MLKKITLENWKSFRHAELYIDPLTVLIGTNASGKSNVVDALDFLNSIMQGTSVEAVLTGDIAAARLRQRFTPGIRGGVEWAVRKPETKFSFQVLVDGENETEDYFYKITIEITPIVQLIDESIISTRSDNFSSSEEPDFIAHFVIENSAFKTSLKNGKEFLEFVYPNPHSWLGKLGGQFIPFYKFDSVEHMIYAHNTIPNLLKNIFIFNPIPSQMRNYSPLSKKLERDGSNIAGVLAALPEQQKAEVEEYLLKYLAKLPEGDMRKVWAETVGRLESDAMLYCEEIWHYNQEPMIVDARGMSDGTLRFLAILTAMLTQPKKSLIVIEEVDNGLHPSRAGLLLQMLREIGEQRKIDVLVTTHNSALLDELTPKFIPFVMVTYRDKKTGESQLIPLEDIEDLPKLMASGTLGKIASKGLIEKSIKADYKV